MYLDIWLLFCKCLYIGLHVSRKLYVACHGFWRYLVWKVKLQHAGIKFQDIDIAITLNVAVCESLICTFHIALQWNTIIETKLISSRVYTLKLPQKTSRMRTNFFDICNHNHNLHTKIAKIFAFLWGYKQKREEKLRVISL